MNFYQNNFIDNTITDNEENIKLFKELNNENKEIRNKIIINNIKFVEYLVSLYNYSHVDYEDIVEYGIIGLMKAIEKYDYTKDIAFTTYSAYYIKKEIHNYIKKVFKPIKLSNYLYAKLRILKKLEENIIQKTGIYPTDLELLNEYNKNNKPISLQTVKSLRIWFKDILPLNTHVNKFEDDFNLEISNEIIDLLEDKEEDFSDNSLNKINYHKIKLIINGTIPSNLTNREKLILNYYFGFDNEPINLSQIGKKLNVSRQVISIGLKTALEKIKKKLLVEKIITKEEFEKTKKTSI